METLHATTFDHPALPALLRAMDDDEYDALDFGLIGFDRAGVVCRYNRHESEAAGLSADRVMGRPLFTEVAPCMNNFMVAQRFADATASSTALDAAVDYVLTLRMRPVRVVLRLLAGPALPISYVLVRRF